MQLGQGVDQKSNSAFSAELFAAELLDLPSVLQLRISEVLLLPSQLDPQLCLDRCGPCRLFLLQGYQALERVDMLAALGNGAGELLCRRVGEGRWRWSHPARSAREFSATASSSP